MPFKHKKNTAKKHPKSMVEIFQEFSKLAVDFLSISGDNKGIKEQVFDFQKGVVKMTRLEKLECKIDEMENKGFGCMFADLDSKRQVPYELFSEELEQVTALYFVKMTDSIFENGIDSLNGVSYIKISL